MEKINIDVLRRIEEFRGMNLSHIWLISELKKGKKHEGIELIYAYLKRKEYVDNDLNLTVEGDRVYKYVFKDAKKKKRNKVVDDYFDIWWSAYPSNTSWEEPITKKKWANSRILRSRGNDCSYLYYRFLEDNPTITHEDMLSAIDYIVYNAKEATILINRGLPENRRHNKMDFLKNSHTFLNDEMGLKSIIAEAIKWKEENKGKTINELLIENTSEGEKDSELLDPKNMF